MILPKVIKSGVNASEAVAPPRPRRNTGDDFIGDHQRPVLVRGGR